MFIKTKKRKKEIEKICKNSLLRKNIFYRKKLCIDNNETEIKIIKINNSKDLLNNLVPKKEWDKNVVFLLPNRKNIDTFLFKKSVDIVCCDVNWKIIQFFYSQEINSLIECHKNTKHIWVMSQNMINQLKISIGDNLSTKSL